jgi:threonine/homoserine/homoserine lactone efflux protein
VILQALGLAGWHELGLFMLATLVLNATPGVDLLLTVTRTLQGGARAGTAAALGINAGCGVHTLAAAFGLAALLAVSGTAFAVIKWAGAAYLLWLAIGMWRAAWRGSRGSAGNAEAPAAGTPARSAWQDFRTGFVTNVLNPKVALFFLAFLPQFIAADAPHKTLAFVGLGLLFMAQSTVFLLLVVALTARLKGLGRSPRLARALQALGGTLFATLAWRVAVSGRGAA